ncbi:hypothetical protein Aeqsu_2968 [Aequorivita sublithincola DSM 14238]|uniref:Uncharacterized protein n=1 Tax=Aequorivita sublithincola (strain DSM 14238 / LMG 21431 / ACAM 643 / 9-3) TaxID=746697 RepID=I3YZJ0_AEQSU|nr:hypothetical protein [Aequorivita sublithincola]AFL82408.1 hypothetical protein Aeqsu_2968 [Aequorivita sublithincola DSM 14238]
MKSKKTLLTLLSAFILGISAFSQTSSKDKIYETFDNIVGVENTGLFNGTEFTDLFLNTDGTYRYFNGFDYVRGSVTYNGEYYVNVLLKYDLLEDNLLTRSDDNLSLFNVKFIPEFVESFSMYNRNFVRLSDTNLGLARNGFYEAAYLGNDLQLYIKHSKRKKDRALNSGIQYKFSEDNFYLLKNKNAYSVIRSTKDLRKALPERADEIKDFYKSYKALYKSNPDSFMTKLVKYLDGSK